MGTMESKKEKRQREQKEEKEIKDRFVSGLTKGPNLTVNKSIKMFCSLSSSENLKQHYETRKIEAGEYAVDLIKNLLEKLGDLTPAPALAGLGSLALCVFIDGVFSSPPEESTKEVLQSAFAEEKASEIWDQIDECLKRCMMNINDDDELSSDIDQIEHQLSGALTKLKNSMVRDGHMSPQALDAWVNGAAFHIQMLIHLARLNEDKTTDPAESLLLAYQSDLEQLFKQHYEMIKGKCKEDTDFHHKISRLFKSTVIDSRYLVDEDSTKHTIGVRGSYDTFFELYYDHRYREQECEVQQYFSGVQQNLQGLVDQKGFFNVS